MARQRSFDPDEVLDVCVDLFWARGFAGVSLQDLEQATGLGRQSLYSAFGDKASLYGAVLARYREATKRWLAPLLEDDAGLDTIRAYAAKALGAQQRHHGAGCLVVKTLWDGGIDASALHDAARAAAADVRNAFEHAIAAEQARGTATAGDAARRADLCFAAVNGLAALQRAGATRRDALESLDTLLDAWRTRAGAR